MTKSYPKAISAFRAARVCARFKAGESRSEISRRASIPMSEIMRALRQGLPPATLIAGLRREGCSARAVIVMGGFSERQVRTIFRTAEGAARMRLSARAADASVIEISCDATPRALKAAREQMRRRIGDGRDWSETPLNLEGLAA